jgi:prepilin signal peptidase PulO-like enzyme (type II secretory pathway)
MFDAALALDFPTILQGIILSLVFGFAAGNYACSLVHRLPRGRLILDQKPYCGTCHTPLQVRDLFPVVSAMLLRHRCRYCGTPFPVSHTWTEVLVGLLFVLGFLQYGFGEQYLLVVCLGVFLITLSAIEANEGLVMGRIVLCVAVFGIIFRVLQDQTLFDSLAGGFYALIVGAVIWHKQIKPVGHIYSLPKPVELLVVGGLCVGIQSLHFLIAIGVTCFALDVLWRTVRGVEKPALLTASMGVAVVLLVLYPKLFVL